MMSGFLLLMGLEIYTGLLDRLCMGTREPKRRYLSGQRRHIQAIVVYIVLGVFRNCSGLFILF
jgi:hypothetical protein